MKPQWQKARVIHAALHPQLEGQEIWVGIGPPQVKSIQDFAGNSWTDEGMLRTNFESWRPSMGVVWIHTKCIELLARNEADFAEDVPIVPFSVWSTSPHEHEPAQIK